MRYFAYVVAAMLLAAAGFTVAAYATPPEGGPPGQGECEHGNSGQECKPDPQPGHGQDCDEHGNHGGVNEDHCLPENPPTCTVDCTPTGTTPTETTPTTPTTPTPPTHDCTFVGADKDGGVDANGGTNDDCAPRPSPPVTPPTVTTGTPQVAAVATTATPAVTPAAPVIVVKPKPNVKPKPKPKPAPVKPAPKPDNPPVKTPKGKHVCATLADGTKRMWYKGGNGLKPGCYAVVQGSG